MTSVHCKSCCAFCLSLLLPALIYIFEGQSDYGNSNILPLYCFNPGLYKSFVRITTSWEWSWSGVQLKLSPSADRVTSTDFENLNSVVQFLSHISLCITAFHYFSLAVIGHISLMDAATGSTGTVDMAQHVLNKCTRFDGKDGIKMRVCFTWNLDYFNKSLTAFTCKVNASKKTALSLSGCIKKLLLHSPQTVCLSSSAYSTCCTDWSVSTWHGHWLEFIYFN